MKKSRKFYYKNHELDLLIRGLVNCKKYIRHVRKEEGCSKELRKRCDKDLDCVDEALVMIVAAPELDRELVESN